MTGVHELPSGQEGPSSTRGKEKSFKLHLSSITKVISSVVQLSCYAGVGSAEG